MNRRILLPISIFCFSIAIIVSANILSKSIINASANLNNGLMMSRQVINNNPQNEDKDIIDLYGAAVLLNTSPDNLIYLLNSNKIDIPCTKIQNTYIFSKKAISTWLEKSHEIK